MFEKEAEERARKLEEKQTLGVYDNDEDLARDEGFNNGEVCGYENGFQDGAGFGYNKAKEELEKENAEAKDIIEDLITKIPASLVEHFESEKERAEKFLGWK